MNQVASPAPAAEPSRQAELSRHILDFARSVRDAVHEDRLTLPTLPDTALRVNTIVNDEDGAIVDVVRAVSTDPAIATRVVQSANSAYAAGATRIDSLQMAVTRLGMQYTRSLVTRLALSQMFRARSGPLLRFARMVWDESLRVAALCQVLARERSDMHPEEAMLGGLLHLVGTLPIIGMADSMRTEDADQEELVNVIRILQPEIGYYLLSEWAFSEDLRTVALVCKDPWRNHDGETDATDIAIVARKLLGLEFLRSLSEDVALPAFQRLRLPYLATVDDLPEFKKAYESAYQSLTA